jgi:putative hemolysin
MRRAVARIVVRCAEGATRWVARLLGETPAVRPELISEAELRDLVATNLYLDAEQRRLIARVPLAGGRHVRELMVPRTEVVFLERNLPIARAVRVIRSSPHSRFPVVDGSRDDVVGFVHLRDLLIRPDADDARTVGELAREVKRLPAAARALAALSEMRREGCHLAVVVDEYGGTAGVVTLEDLIEELVGEIHDEYDLAPEPGVADGVAPSHVDGLLNLNDFAERVGFSLPPGPYETLAGFLMAQLGRLPEIGDEVRWSGWRLVVSAMDGRRVDRVALIEECPGSPDGDLEPGFPVRGVSGPARAEQVVGHPAHGGAADDADVGYVMESDREASAVTAAHGEPL